MAAPDFSTKVGTTFYAECALTDDSGNPVDMAGAGITPSSSLLSPDGARRVPLSVDMLDQATDPGRYTVRTETDDFAPGYWTWDVRYLDANGDFTTLTETVRIAFASAVTL